MSCTIDTSSIHPDISTGSLQAWVQYAWGADLASAASVAASNRMHKLTGTTSVNTIPAPSAGDGHSRLVTLVASGQAAFAPVVVQHLSGGGNLSLRSGVNLGLYAGDTITFAWNVTDAKWYEISRDQKPEIDYVQVTGGLTPTHNSEASADTFITSDAVTVDGATPMLFHFFAPQASSPIQIGSGIFGSLFDGATPIGQLFSMLSPGSGNGDFKAVTGEFRYTPAAGAHTWTVRCWYNGSSPGSAITGGAGGAGNFVPAFLRISRAN